MENKTPNKNEASNLHKPPVSTSAVSDADKALEILKSFHDLAHNSEKSEGVVIVKDWDINTLTIMTKQGHNHFGQMNNEDEKGFSILINELWKHYCR